MFEDIGKKESVTNVIKNAREVINFIYNHGSLLAKMWEFFNGELVRPVPTRFTTNYIALNCLIKKKASQKRLFTSDEWKHNHSSQTQTGKNIEERILDNHFWDIVAYVVSIYERL